MFRFISRNEAPNERLIQVIKVYETRSEAMNQDRTLYIIRGLPGSGKSTLAQRITPHFFEADQYFVVNGTYTYNSEKLAEAHALCQNNVKQAMSFGIPLIAVSNTFTRHWEMKVYKEMAQLLGYTVVEISMHGKFNSIHNVSPEAMQKMRDMWQP